MENLEGTSQFTMNTHHIRQSWLKAIDEFWDVNDHTVINGRVKSLMILGLLGEPNGLKIKSHGI